MTADNVQDTLSALLPRLTLLDERLNGPGKCHSGHTTLPVALWDCPECVNIIRAERDAYEKEAAIFRDATARLREAGARLVGAVEACAVAERGGPPVNWEAVDASQDAMRAAIKLAATAPPAEVRESK